MLYYDRIDVSEVTDVNEISASKRLVRSSACLTWEMMFNFFY